MMQKTRPRTPTLLRRVILACALLAGLPLVGTIHREATIHGTPGIFPFGFASAGESTLFTESPEQLRAEIDGNFRQVERLIAQNDIRGARSQISILRMKIDKNKLTRKEKKTLKKRLQSLDKSIQQKVDSLITVNLTIIQKQGSRAGYEFRQKLSRQTGVSDADLASVDQAIVERNTFEETGGAPPPVTDQSETPAPQMTVEPAKEQITLPDSPVQPAPQPAAVETPEPALSMVTETPHPARTGETSAPEPAPAPAVPAAAAKPVQEDRDMENSRIRASQQAIKIRSLLDARKVEEASTVFNIYQVQMQRYLDADTYKTLKSNLDEAVKLDQERQNRAAQKVREIERLLESDRITEAFVSLNKERDSLKRYFDKKELRALGKKVSQAYEGFIKTQLAANETKRSIEKLLSENKVEKAYTQFGIRREQLKRGLSRESFEKLRKQVASAHQAILDRQKQSESIAKDIFRLISDRKGADAAALFNGNKELLREHLAPGHFSSLSDEVEKARQAFLTRQKKARVLANTIDSLVTSRREKEAHALFQMSKDDLRADLADDKRFFALQDRQSEAYSLLQKKERAARRTAKTIRYLIRNKQGSKAYDLFKKEQTSLRNHTDRDAFEKLKNAALRADAAYTQHREEAKQTAASIETLLQQDAVEQAFHRYRKAKPDFDFYLEDDASIDVLQKNVKRAYKALQERRQWAASQVKQIRKYIQKGRGNQAFDLYRATREKLTLDIDEKNIIALDRDVNRANAAYNDAVDRAQKKAADIRSLLGANRIEEACDAFNASEADLRSYCREKEFNDLRKQVESSNKALKGKKREAMRIVKTMDGLIQKEQGDTAYKIFSANDALLSEYLAPATYKNAANRAEAAKKEFAKKRRNAQNIEKNLLDQLRQNRVLSASKRFDNERELLEHYLDKNRYIRLKTAIAASSDAFMKERKKAQAIVVSLRKMIRDYKGVEAEAEYSRRERTFARYLPSEEYRDITAMVEKAYNSTVQGRNEAKETADAIRQLIDQNEITYACATFKEMRPVLERYTSNDAFSALETEVNYAREEYEKKTKQCQQYAKELNRLVKSNKGTTAFRKFRSHRRELEKYLDQETFAALKESVYEAYKKTPARGKKRR
jgi:hypothetical protein